MRIKFIFVLIILGSVNIYSQANGSKELTGGMGIAFEHSPSVTDYINFNFAQSNQISTSFHSTIEGWLEYDFRYDKNLKLGLEYSFNYYAYSNINNIGFVYEFDKTIQSFTPLIYYYRDGKGYELKLGGGFGYRFAYVNEKIYDVKKYKANGFGILLRAEGLTALGSNFFANIGGDIRFDYIGTVENSTERLTNNITGEAVNLSSFIFGVKIGVSYLFN